MKTLIKDLSGYMKNEVRPNDILEGYFFGLSKHEYDHVVDCSYYHTVHTIVNTGNNKMQILHMFKRLPLFGSANVIGYLIKE